MALPDLSPELPSLGDDAPCGPNLEFDGDFGELERSAAGKPEQQFGDTVIPAEPPPWKEVATAAAALTERTHDLRVLCQLAVARLQLQGLPGFVPVLGMIRNVLTAQWEQVHPQLDPEDDNDPTFRANALLQLGHPARVLRVLREMPLASSRRDGPVSWRSISILRGELEPTEEAERKSDATIRAAFTDTGAEALADRKTLLDTAIAHVAGIGAAFDNATGYGNAPDLQSFTRQLQDMSRFISLFSPEADAPIEEVPVEEMEALGETEESGPAASAPRRATGFASIAQITAVHSRADALRLLDLACAYYETHEPTSPLPLLVRRARRLAEKRFLELLHELAPNGLDQARDIVQSRDQGY